MRGWEVDLLVLHSGKNSYISRLSNKVKLVELKARRARYAGPAVLWYLIKNKPDSLVVFKYELIDLLIILKIIFRLNLDVIGRNISVFGKKKEAKVGIRQKIIKKLFGEPIERVDCVINQSYEMQKDLLKHLPSLKDKSVVIHNPVSAHIEEYKKADQPVRASETSPYILCVGRLEEVKAFHHAINAFAIVAKKHQSLRLKFVGDGSLKPALVAQVTGLGLEGRVNFEGFQTDVIPFYENASLTLLTSNYEGFPNVLIESIVLGTPVVSFDCESGPREILDYGRYGKLVEPGN
ncbi:hypothetical protein AQ621_12545, partial [Marinobacter sp. P4B1]